MTVKSGVFVSPEVAEASRSKRTEEQARAERTRRPVGKLVHRQEAERSESIPAFSDAAASQR